MIFNVSGGGAPDVVGVGPNGVLRGVGMFLDEWSVPVMTGEHPTNKSTNLAHNIDATGFYTWWTCFVKKVILPSYFEGGNIGAPISNWQGDYSWINGLCRVEEIEDLASNTTTQTDQLFFPTLKKLTTQASGTLELWVTAGTEDLPDITINAPNAVTVTLQTPTTDPYMRTVVLNAPSATSFCKASGPDKGSKHINGTMNIKSVKKIYEWAVPLSGVTELYLDALEEIDSRDFAYEGSNGGTMKLYIGPHLGSIHNECISRVISCVSNGSIEFHISPGINTTKTTLDSAGISYIQDYEPIG